MKLWVVFFFCLLAHRESFLFGREDSKAEGLAVTADSCLPAASHLPNSVEPACATSSRINDVCTMSYGAKISGKIVFGISISMVNFLAFGNWPVVDLVDFTMKIGVFPVFPSFQIFGCFGVLAPAKGNDQASCENIVRNCCVAGNVSFSIKRRELVNCFSRHATPSFQGSFVRAGQAFLALDRLVIYTQGQEFRQ